MLVNEEFNQISSFLVSFPGLFPSGSAWCELFTGANATRKVKFLLFFYNPVKTDLAGSRSGRQLMISSSQSRPPFKVIFSLCSGLGENYYEIFLAVSSSFQG